jgi:hypothetical protein
MRLVVLVASALPMSLAAQTQQANAAPAAANKTYEAVIQGMSCKQQASGRMDCEYRVGKSLRFTIAGVGQSDVVINFFKVNVDDDFFASVAPLHGCVVVRPAAARSDTISQLAFVSPQDGKIYRNWNTCATKRR